MELRRYQRKIVQDADKQNALIVLPTGTGSIALPLLVCCVSFDNFYALSSTGSDCLLCEL